MTRVLIADDHALVRRGMRQLLGNLPDISVAGEVDSGAAVLTSVDTVAPDVLLLDVSMPEMNFLDMLARLRDSHPSVRVLVVSIHAEEVYARRAIRAGAAGYITKAHADEELIEAVRTVARGGRYISRALAQELATELASGHASMHHAVTPREQEVMLLLAAGHTVTEIANRLSLSIKTVSTHRTNLLRKMSLRTNADLARYALEHGLIH